MKKEFSLIIICLFMAFNIEGQVIDYYPEQKQDMPDDQYRRGIMILEQTYKNVKKNDGNFNYSNYWNLAIAYQILELKSDSTNFKEMLYKSKELNPENFAILFLSVTSEAKKEYPRKSLSGFLTEKEYFKLYEEVENIQRNKKSVLKPEMIKPESLDSSLISIIKMVKINDTKYRKVAEITDVEKQNKLDEINLMIIDSLYNKHQKYIGKSLVGEEYEYVMWSVIQHSNIQNMDNYLSVIHTATLDNEIPDVLLEMLLDRIYTIKYGYQFFGSQEGVPLGTELKIQEIIAKYFNDK